MFIDKLFLLCEANKINLDTKFMQKLGIAPSTLSNWLKSKERGVEVLPSTNHLIAICKFFNVSADYLLDTNVNDNIISPNEKSLLSNYRVLQNIDKNTVYTLAQNLAQAETSRELTPQTILLNHCIFEASAGTGCSVWETNAFEPIEVLKTYYSVRADFCLTISGNSMQPDYNDGDIVLVKAQSDIDIGQIGIFTRGNEGYIKEKGKNRLISLNPTYPDIIPSEYDNLICQGLVIGKL